MNTGKFQIGDEVIIARNSHEQESDENGFNYDYFNEFVGKKTHITDFNSINVDGKRCYYTNINYRYGKLSVCETDIEPLNESDRVKKS